LTTTHANNGEHRVGNGVRRLIAAVVTGGGVSGKEPLLMIQTSIALSVATEAPQRFSLQIS
jgi:hypothetical protein